MENELEKNIGIFFKNKKLLIIALTHNSYSNEQKILYKKKVESFEKLEFLGDAILEFVVTEFLYNKYNKLTEGVLTKYRSAIINGNHLSNVAKKINLGKYLYLSKGEIKNKGYEKIKILEDAMEALIGAIYLDQGMELVKKFVYKYILSNISSIISMYYIDAKTKLQELIQGKYNITPKYNVIEEYGLDHDKNYVSAVFVGDVKIGQGIGKNKKKSELDAAENALKNLENCNYDINKCKKL